MSDTEWLYAKDVAADLDVSRTTACSRLKRIPGAELVYRFVTRKGERWRVSRAAYDAWRASGQTGQTGQTG